VHKIPVPVLILQHPQEPSRKDHEKSSAGLIEANIDPSLIVTGLSWRNLESILKRWKHPLFQDPENFEHLKHPKNWWTLYLGTKTHTEAKMTEPGIYFLSKKGELAEAPKSAEVSGIILLDGTWAQAKTLWWRNAWLLKTQRIALQPKTKSLYGNIRREPRPECVSTLEALAEVLSFMGVDPKVEDSLKEKFKSILKK
jgi:DTW domain-containing protein YfiP